MKLKEMLEASKLKNNILKITLLVLFMSIFNSLSYAYFTSTVEGNGNEMVLSTSDITINFTDSEAIKKTGLAPGSTITKTFTITNNGSSTAGYKINWEYLINNFEGRENLVYEISSNNGGGTLEETQLPDSEEHINILANLTINKDVTQNYTMTITYKDNGQNQDLDKNKSLIGKLEVTDVDGNSILPETSTGSSASPVSLEKNLYGMTVKKLMNEIYPVGSVYISFENTNPSEKFGGSWERVDKGKTLINVDEDDTTFASVGKTGGNKTIDLSHSHTVNAHAHATKDHTLTIDEMPNHDHSAPLRGHLDYMKNPFYVWYGENGLDYYGNYIGTGAKNLRVTPGVYAQGGDQAHNHGETTESSPGTNSQLSSTQSVLNPYVTVYMWKRIS